MVANAANRVHPHRVLMEKAMGIHRDKLLPEFASETFPNWARRELNGLSSSRDGRHKVVLFSTCFVNWNKPQIGQAAFRVLRHNDCQVAAPELRCCGMPALDGGDIRRATEAAKDNVRALLPWVEQGYSIAAINPTCSLMMKEEYPELLDNSAEPALRDAARKVAAATRDLGEYLFERRQAGEFKEDFRSTPERSSGLPRSVSPAKTERRLPWPRSDAAHSRGQAETRGGMLWPRRHLGDEEGILRAVAQER
jgi:Fe-S oxidoreductase